jgi:hypothetical protein
VPGNTSSGIAIDKQGQAYVPGSGAGIDVPGTPVTNQNPVIIRRRIDGGVFLNGTPFTPQGSTIPTSDGGTPPPGQGQGGGISPNDGALTTPQNTLTPSTGNTPPANPATTDGDGKATFFFNYKPAISKGADIKTETGTAESGTQVALNTQPAQGQSVQVKFSFPHAPLPTPNTDQGALQGDWNAGGAVTATVKPDQMSSVTMPLKDNWLGLPQQGPNINLRLDLNNPNVTSYLVKTPVGQIPNFTSLVTSDTVVTGDFNGDGVGDVLMSDGSGGFNIWMPTQFFFFNPNIPGIAKPTQSLGEFLDNWQPMVKDRLWFWGGFGAQRVQIGDGMTLGNNTYTQVTGFNTDPGKPLQDTFGNNSVLINNCEGPYPGPWEIEPAHYAPGSDLPEAAVTLAKPQRRIMR